ncbi:hypothetical protein AWENTII_009173 [Aspergillus wentii]
MPSRRRCSHTVAYREQGLRDLAWFTNRIVECKLQHEGIQTENSHLGGSKWAISARQMTDDCRSTTVWQGISNHLLSLAALISRKNLGSTFVSAALNGHGDGDAGREAELSCDLSPRWPVAAGL